MILALESSCDETAVAVFDPARGLAGEWVHSQIALHETYGGVVPDLAAPAEFADRFGFAPVEDLQLNAAREVLRGVLVNRENRP